MLECPDNARQFEDSISGEFLEFLEALVPALMRLLDGRTDIVPSGVIAAPTPAVPFGDVVPLHEQDNDQAFAPTHTPSLKVAARAAAAKGSRRMSQREIAEAERRGVQLGCVLEAQCGVLVLVLMLVLTLVFHHGALPPGKACVDWTPCCRGHVPVNLPVPRRWVRVLQAHPKTLTCGRPWPNSQARRPPCVPQCPPAGRLPLHQPRTSAAAGHR